jgi:hypothetical protein
MRLMRSLRRAAAVIHLYYLTTTLTKRLVAGDRDPTEEREERICGSQMPTSRIRTAPGAIEGIPST